MACLKRRDGLHPCGLDHLCHSHLPRTCRHRQQYKHQYFHQPFHNLFSVSTHSVLNSEYNHAPPKCSVPLGTFSRTKFPSKALPYRWSPYPVPNATPNPFRRASSPVRTTAYHSYTHKVWLSSPPAISTVFFRKYSFPLKTSTVDLLSKVSYGKLRLSMTFPLRSTS